MDHTQLQPVYALPFLLSSHILTCFRMRQLQQCVRAGTDEDVFKHIQYIARLHPGKYKEDPSLLVEFRSLASKTFTFVQTWESPPIDANTFCLYGKKFPAKEATRNFTDHVPNSLCPNEYV